MADAGDAEDGVSARVFCSFRRPDRPIVEEFVGRLRADGIDARLDERETGSGREFISKLTEGLFECDVGVVFLSAGITGSDTELLGELNAFGNFRVEDGKRLVLVVVDDIAENVIRAQPLWRMLHRYSVDGYGSIRDTLVNGDHRPGPPAT